MLAKYCLVSQSSKVGTEIVDKDGGVVVLFKLVFVIRRSAQEIVLVTIFLLKIRDGNMAEVPLSIIKLNDRKKTNLLVTNCERTNISE